MYLFLERGEGREKERSINLWLTLARPPLGTWPAIQACALTGNQTSEPLVHRLALNPLSHTSQGYFYHFKAGCQLLEICSAFPTLSSTVFS